MDKIVFQTEDKKLTFTEIDNIMSIDFFSIEEDNEFIIPSSNKEIYNIFKNTLNKINGVSNDINEMYIYDEESLRNSLVIIQVLENEIKLIFSSSFYTSITLNIEQDNIHSNYLNELYNSFKNLDIKYYQTYIDEVMNERKEYRIEISG